MSDTLSSNCVDSLRHSDFDLLTHDLERVSETQPSEHDNSIGRDGVNVPTHDNPREIPDTHPSDPDDPGVEVTTHDNLCKVSIMQPSEPADLT